MPTKEVTLSSKHQIVILEARKVLGLKPGDKLLIVTPGNRSPCSPRCVMPTRPGACSPKPEGLPKAERTAWMSPPLDWRLARTLALDTAASSIT